MKKRMWTDTYMTQDEIWKQIYIRIITWILKKVNNIYIENEKKKYIHFK